MRRINNQMLNFMNVCPVEAEVFHADGRTDMTKQTATFNGFANTPKIIVQGVLISP